MVEVPDVRRNVVWSKNGMCGSVIPLQCRYTKVSSGGATSCLFDPITQSDSRFSVNHSLNVLEVIQISIVPVSME